MKLRVLVAMVLALPLFLVGVPAQQASASELTITATTAGTKRVGDKTAVWGTVSGPDSAWARVEVEVEVSPGSWSRSNIDYATKDGYYEVALTYGFTTPGTYNYRVVADDWDGNRATSPVVTLTRTPWSIGSAGTKPVRQDTSVWGPMPDEFSYAETWTEARIDGRWTKSQWDFADRSSLALPLSYGRDRAGDYQYRVVSRNYQGFPMYSAPFTLRRTAHVSASYSGTKLVGADTSAWGNIYGVPNGQAWTEALVGGRWQRSQTVTTDSNGRYEIPLTYGRTWAGTQTFRVVGTSPFGNVYSPAFKVTRIW